MASFITRQKPSIGLRWCPQWAGKKWNRKFVVIVGEGRVELVRPMDPAAIDDHHDLFARLRKVAIT